MALTDVKIRQAKPTGKPQKLSDSGGLYVQVMPNGSKLWRYRYEIGGRENVYAIGDYPAVSLADARQERDAARVLVKQGIHPSHDRAQKRTSQIAANKNTFQAVAEEWQAAMRERWTEYYASQIADYFAADVYPKIGRRPIRSVTAADILDILKSIEARGAPTVAINVRQWASAVFRYGVANLRADSDPAAATRGAIVRGEVVHASAMSDDQIARLVHGIAHYGGARRTVIALQLMLLLFPRTVELRRSKPEQFELTADPQWRVPVQSMKKRRLHLVPLPTQAIPLVRELLAITAPGQFLFPNMRDPGKCMSATTINRALQYLGHSSGERSGHDFRATASTMLHEMGYRSELVEMQLAHAKKDKTSAAYNHAKYLPERREMMQAWADHIDKIVASRKITQQPEPLSAAKSKHRSRSLPSRKHASPT